MEYDYSKKAPSLEVRALVKLAISLCQQESFKMAILCLERLGYQENENIRIREHECRENRLAKWDMVVEKQSKILSESVSLPNSMKKSLMDWTSRIALEYLCWCRRLEVVFGVNRFYSMNFTTVEDWTCEGRLDEKKLCERLAQDEGLTIIQRYTFACAYFCYSDSDDCLISTLWQKLNEEDKLALMNSKEQKYFEKDNIVSHLVKVWSLYLYGKMQLNDVLKSGLEEWTDMGSCATVQRCWNMVSQECQRTIVVQMGLRAVLRWYRSKWNWWRLRLVNPEKDKYFMKRTFVPSCYYTELVCFYLSQMTTDERMTFFLEALKDSRYAPVLECFLEWNYQEHFISTLTCLWDFIPMNSYVKLLLTVASRHTGDYDMVFSTLIYKREDQYYDFRCLLLELWKETPDRFKRFLFRNQEANQTLLKEVINHGHRLLLRILKKKQFEEADVELFKCIFSDATVDEKNAIFHSGCAKDIFSMLMEKQNWGLIEWVLNQSLSNEEMVSLKKDFMQSRGGKFCFRYIEEEIQSVTKGFLEDFLDWVFTTPGEKSAFKFQLLYRKEFMLKCQTLTLENDFLVLDRVINWCLDTECQKNNFKMGLPKIKEISESFLENRKWTLFDKFLIWCNDSRTQVLENENHGNFIQRTIEVNHNLVIIRHKKPFYRWLGLTSEAIKKLNIVFTPRKANFIINWLNSTKDLVDILSYLRTWLHNKNSILYFETIFQEKYLKRKLMTNVLQERFNFLITKLIRDF